MKEWHIIHNNKSEKWDEQQRQMLRTYYSQLYELDSKKVYNNYIVQKLK